MWRSIKKWLLGWSRGGPHAIIGGPDDPYLLRWYVIPRNGLFNVYVHKFIRDDDDRAMHDHPWPSLSLVLSGGYVEQTKSGKKWHGPGSVIRRSAEYIHRIELPGGRPAWTLFITGPKVREWGFHCPKGWVPWRQFVSADDPGRVGPGCGD